MEDELIKEQRQITITLIHECQVQIKNASPEEKKQIWKDCKALIKEINGKFSDLRKQQKDQLKELKASFESQIKNENYSENQSHHFNNSTKQSEKELYSHENVGEHYVKKFKHQIKSSHEKKERQDKDD